DAGGGAGGPRAVDELEHVAGTHQAPAAQREGIEEIDHLGVVAVGAESADEFPPGPVVATTHAGRDHEDSASIHRARNYRARRHGGGFFAGFGTPLRP